MIRRVWIIDKKDQLEQKDFDDAALNNCPEIANGIPPALADVLSPNQLPISHEEPEAPKPSVPVRDLAAEIDEVKARIGTLEKSRIT